MLVGDRFEKDGKYYEVTRVIDDHDYSFREIPPEPKFEPVFNPVVEEPKEEAKEVKEEVQEPKEEVREVRRRGRKKV